MHCFYYCHINDIDVHCVQAGSKNKDIDSGNQYDGKKNQGLGRKGMKKKLIQINTVCNTSTGRIMLDIQKKAEEEGGETLSCIGRRKVNQNLPCVKYGGFFSFWFHVAINTAFDKQGYGSFLQQKGW